MTADKFRSLALSIPDSMESAHNGHPDFRVAGRVFATLGYPDDQHAMVKLSPERQRQLVEQAPDVFSPCSGAWGRGGATAVCLPAARVGSVRAALEEASHFAKGSSFKQGSRIKD